MGGHSRMPKGEMSFERGRGVGSNQRDVSESELGNGSSEDEGLVGEGSSEEEEDSSSASEAPQRKVIPHRTSRGKKMRLVDNEMIEKDKAFWDHDTWQEDAGDDEWSTEDEHHYDDEFESDFDESSDSDAGEEADDSDLKDDSVKKRKKNVYTDPKKQTQRGSPKKKATAFPKKRPWSEVHGGSKKQRVLTQSEHLKRAKGIEEQNLKNLHISQEQENLKKMLKEVPQTVWKGPYSLLISWASNRIIESEVKDANQPQDDDDEEEDVYERVMLFFVDFTNPPSSTIPKYLQQSNTLQEPEPRVCTITGDKAKYFDPLTKQYYSSCEAFRCIRQRYHKAKEAEFMRSLKPLLDIQSEHT